MMMRMMVIMTVMVLKRILDQGNGVFKWIPRCYNLMSRPGPTIDPQCLPTGHLVPSSSFDREHA